METLKLHEPVCMFSPDMRYRYTLWREVNPQGEGYVQWIALNPSTADVTNDDPTVRRMQAFSRDWDARWCLVTNVFAFRATDPKVMKAQTEPFGPDNLFHIGRLAKEARIVVAAWGTHGNWMNGDEIVCNALGVISTVVSPPFKTDLKCLGKTKYGHPKHPLYVRADTQLIDYP